jgi:hypothetical protein
MMVSLMLMFTETNGKLRDALTLLIPYMNTEM